MDVSHELGALRFVVDSPLSSKVAMFNQQVDQHKQSQLLNPFSNTDGRASPKPTFSKDEYGKPLAGSLTEMRGQKANIHVLKEMLELCQIIDSEGYNVKDEPTMRVIPFGELFNIYNYISDKVVGILLRARKHKLVEFEGEMLFQRRDDDVPIFLIKPIHEIRRETEDKIESVKRAGSPAPQATSVLLDKKGRGLDIPKGTKSRSSVSRTPSPQNSKDGTPVRDTKAKQASAAAPIVTASAEKIEGPTKPTKTEVVENKPKETSTPAVDTQTPKESQTKEAPQMSEIKEQAKLNEEVLAPQQQSSMPQTQDNAIAATIEATKTKTDVNNNNSNNANNSLPKIVIDTTSVSEGPATTEEATEPDNATTPITNVVAVSETNVVESITPSESTPSA